MKRTIKCATRKNKRKDRRPTFFYPGNKIYAVCTKKMEEAEQTQTKELENHWFCNFEKKWGDGRKIPSRVNLIVKHATEGALHHKSIRVPQLEKHVHLSITDEFLVRSRGRWEGRHKKASLPYNIICMYHK